MWLMLLLLSELLQATLQRIELLGHKAFCEHAQWEKATSSAEVPACPAHTARACPTRA